MIILAPILMALFTFGLFHSGDEGMIAQPVRESLQSKVDRGFFPSWLGKPIMLCSPCMNSLWGSLVYWLFGVFVVRDPLASLLVFWPVSVVIGVAISILLESLYSSLHRNQNGNAFRDQSIDNGSGHGPDPQ